MRPPQDILEEDLGISHADGYEIDCVEAGMRECHETLTVAAKGLAKALTQLRGTADTEIRSALILIEQTLTEIEG